MQSAPSLGRLERLHDAHAVAVGEHELARLDLALERRADEVERAGLGRDDGVVAEPAEHERAEAVRVAEREQRAVGEADDGRGAFEPRHRARDRLLERPLVVGDQRRDHLASRSSTRAACRARRAAPSALTRLPLWPSATVRTRPWWSSGCAFAQALPPVVE